MPSYSLGRLIRPRAKGLFVTTTCGVLPRGILLSFRGRPPCEDWNPQESRQKGSSAHVADPRMVLGACRFPGVRNFVGQRIGDLGRPVIPCCTRVLVQRGIPRGNEPLLREETSIAKRRQSPGNEWVLGPCYPPPGNWPCTSPRAS